MKKYILAAVGLILGVALVWVLFRDTNWDEVGASIRGISVAWLALAHVPLLLTFPFRVQRWSYIVRAAQPVSFRNLFSATQVGFLANFVLPGRAGEAIRALILTRLTEIKFSKSLAFVALDRVTDLFGLITVIGVSILAFHPKDGVTIPPETFGTSGPITFTNNQYQMGAIGAGAFLLAILATFVLLYVRRSFVLKVERAVLGVASRKLAEYVAGMLEQFADGLHVFRSPGDMAKAIAWSLMTWGMSMLSMVCLLEAFHIDYPWYAPFVIQALLAVAISAPNTPGFVGQFHVPIVVALVMTVPSLGADAAKAYAIVLHLMQLPPVLILGVYCLMRERMGLLQLRSEGEELSRSAEDATFFSTEKKSR